MAGLTSLAALEGRWRLDRRILHDDGAENRFAGTAHFQRSGHHMVMDEDGVLSGPGGRPGLKATRRYIWVQDGPRIEVLFHDMRPFHTIPLGVVRPETTYLCPPDRYHVSYEFTRAGAWTARWRVDGPKKSYEMTSTFTRPGKDDAAA